jgi:DNA replication protein DnaC
LKPKPTVLNYTCFRPPFTTFPIRTRKSPQPTLADAILDRIIHHAHRLQLSGDSLRKQNTPK